MGDGCAAATAASAEAEQHAASSASRTGAECCGTSSGAAEACGAWVGMADPAAIDDAGAAEEEIAGAALGIPGLYYFRDFLSEKEADALAAAIDAGPASGRDSPPAARSGSTGAAGAGASRATSGRPVVTGPGVHWHGFVGGTGASRLARCAVGDSGFDGDVAACRSAPLPLSVPEVCRDALLRLRVSGAVPEDYAFDQAIINSYPEGSQGIASHVDRQKYDSVVVGFSLGASVVMDFAPACRRGTQAPPPRELLLEARSAYVLSGEARQRWTHGIRPGPHTYRGKDLSAGHRVSVTFRRNKLRAATTAATADFSATEDAEGSTSAGCKVAAVQEVAVEVWSCGDF